jgi:hypothetical protein
MNGKEIHDSIAKLKYAMKNHQFTSLETASYDLLFAAAKLFNEPEYAFWENKIEEVLTTSEQLQVANNLIGFVIIKLDKRRTIK